MPDPEVIVRPLVVADDEAARAVAFAALSGVSRRLDREPHAMPDDEPTQDRMRARVSRCRETDPAGAWAAERDGQVVGVALALRRGPLWFLSLLAVTEGLQGRGVGARLMAAAMTTYDGAGAGLITASRDARALRRYQLAGFRLEPCFEANGAPDLRAAPAAQGVRPGDLRRDRDLCEEVAGRQRGVGHGGDLDAMLAAGARLFVADAGPERGFALVRAGAVWLVAATSDVVAQRLLWAALAGIAAAGEEAAVSWVTARQQWALDVCLAARLALWSGGAVAVRGEPGPLTPYLPSGAWG